MEKLHRVKALKDKGLCGIGDEGPPSQLTHQAEQMRLWEIKASAATASVKKSTLQLLPQPLIHFERTPIATVFLIH